MPNTVNCAFDSATCVIFNATVPEFFTETVCVACLPTVTCPKLMLVELSWKDPSAAACFEFAVTAPAHPFNNATVIIRVNSAKNIPARSTLVT